MNVRQAKFWRAPSLDGDQPPAWNIVECSSLCKHRCTLCSLILIFELNHYSTLEIPGIWSDGFIEAREHDSGIDLEISRASVYLSRFPCLCSDVLCLVCLKTSRTTPTGSNWVLIFILLVGHYIDKAKKFLVSLA